MVGATIAKSLSCRNIPIYVSMWVLYWAVICYWRFRSYMVNHLRSASVMLPNLRSQGSWESPCGRKYMVVDNMFPSASPIAKMTASRDRYWCHQCRERESGARLKAFEVTKQEVVWIIMVVLFHATVATQPQSTWQPPLCTRFAKDVHVYDDQHLRLRSWV